LALELTSDEIAALETPYVPHRLAGFHLTCRIAWRASSNRGRSGLRPVASLPSVCLPVHTLADVSFRSFS